MRKSLYIKFVISYLILAFIGFLQSPCLVPLWYTIIWTLFTALPYIRKPQILPKTRLLNIIGTGFPGKCSAKSGNIVKISECGNLAD